ncbi:MAG: Multifunctional-autoprocessing repeats-in-toxin [Chlamydiae bacterium]|nr:Multifunctional-autoprocessing repeats-in-toxin [Chlamydiota bacterium]
MPIELKPVEETSITYKSEWPKHLDPALKSTSEKITRFVWNLLSVIIFPIGLYRIASSYIRDRVLSIIVPGIIVGPDSLFQIPKWIFQFFFNRPALNTNLEDRGKDILDEHKGSSLILTAADGATLDGAFFPGKTHPKKAIIYLGGNGEQWELMFKEVRRFQSHGTSVLLFNPRGVGKSTGTRYEQGYALDVFAAYQFLISKKNIDPEDILLIGYSMGAAIGACGASLVQKEYPDKKISGVNIFSFSDLNLEIDEILKDFGGILSRIGRLANRMIGFDLCPKKAWETLKGTKWIFHNPHDGIILEKASLKVAVDEKTSNIFSFTRPWPHVFFFHAYESKILDNEIIPNILKLNHATTQSA